MYPNPNLITHDGSGRSRQALSEAGCQCPKQAYPWFFYGEAFSMDHDYATTTFVSQDTPRPGFVDYSDTRRFYEFVDDNDDQDRFPDNQRIDWLTGDFQVFPGWDENNDFISDFNQNDNRRSQRRNEFPDYEEPFLRYNVDRPEFLFGIDMNNNGWIDRFENDEEPDYPYKRDHRGYNLYTGVHITPDIRLMVGRIDERLLSEDRANETNYLLVTFDRDYPGFGRLRFFDMFKLIEDDIPENLFQWVYLTSESEGELRRPSALSYSKTPGTTAPISVRLYWLQGLDMINKVKYDLTHTQRGQSQKEYFLGLINKVSTSWKSVRSNSSRLEKRVPQSDPGIVHRG